MHASRSAVIVYSDNADSRRGFDCVCLRRPRAAFAATR